MSQNYCADCAVPIPDGQKFCSMCYGDMEYGKDGYYRDWYLQQLEEEENEKREDEERERSEMSEKLARRFHEIYERLAPLYGYETRKDTREFDPQSNNGRLMIAVTSEIERELEYKNERLKDLVQWLETIESDLREELETQTTKHKWQTGQPEHEGEYWVVAQDLDGNLFYSIDTWVIDKNYSMWIWLGRHDDETGEPLSNVIAWQEIEPYVLEIGEGE